MGGHGRVGEWVGGGCKQYKRCGMFTETIHLDELADYGACGIGKVWREKFAVEDFLKDGGKVFGGKAEFFSAGCCDRSILVGGRLSVLVWCRCYLPTYRSSLPAYVVEKKKIIIADSH